jgi:hypothetical protein
MARPCFRRAQAWSSEKPSVPVRPALRQVPVVAWLRPAVAAAQETAGPSAMKAAEVTVMAEVARQVAWARRGLLLVEVAAVASGAQAQPRAAAEEWPVPSARPPGVAEVVSGARGRRPEAAMAERDAAVQPQAVVAAVEPDVEAERPPVEVAEARLDAEEPLPAEGRQAPSARLPAAGCRAPPSVLLSTCRAGQILPSPAPRQAGRSAHALRKSRTASPSKQWWRAAGCEA